MTALREFVSFAVSSSPCQIASYKAVAPSLYKLSIALNKTCLSLVNDWSTVASSPKLMTSALSIEPIRFTKVLAAAFASSKG